jgi:endoglucanase
MRRIAVISLILCVWMISNTQAQSPFSRGVNLTGWFQTSNAKQIQFTKYSFKDFSNIKSLGCDVIRLPINLHFMTSGSPGYIIDPLFYTFLDSAVTWAESLEIKLILDNHTFDPAVNTDPNVGPVLRKVWIQMAKHYKNRSSLIYYEVLNEPHGITDNAWGKIQQSVIDTIRTVDSLHIIVVGPASWNSYNNLVNLPTYKDTNLVYTFHFYDPFIFTHQGATWTDPSMGPLAGVPFPYSADSMPTCPTALKGSWVESEISTGYKTNGTIAKVKSLIDIAVAFKNKRNVKIFCGEFGVYIPNSPDSARVFWYKTVCDYLNANNIPWTIWDYQGGFGLFKKNSNEMFDYDLNIPLLKALNLNVPPQQVYNMTPDTAGFMIYSDYIGANILESSNPGSGTINFYSTDLPNNGVNDIYFKVGAQYTTVGFDFSPNKDLSVLKDSGYALDMLIRSADKGGILDLRFIDTKTSDPADHPWRIRYTIDGTKNTWDGYWHKLHIPLKSFTEHGSWDNGAWLNPEGKYDWKAVDRFEIDAEYTEAINKRFWFDNIQITKLDTTQIQDTAKIIVPDGISKKPITIKLLAYPNPMKNNITISYSILSADEVDISVYNLLGWKLKTLVHKRVSAGNYSTSWDGKGVDNKEVPAGIYMIKVAFSSTSEMIRIVKN